MKKYVGVNIKLDTSEQKKRDTILSSEKNMQDSSSSSDHTMRESFSQSVQRIKETNVNTEDENIDNGNISTDRSETESPSDEVNI